MNLHTFERVSKTRKRQGEITTRLLRDLDLEEQTRKVSQVQNLDYRDTTQIPDH